MKQAAEGLQPVALCDATSITNCEPVKDFDVKKLYKDNREVKPQTCTPVLPFLLHTLTPALTYIDWCEWTD